ncbi:hypothetical protein ACFYW1_28035 [Streptomyces sp. NPDC002669]|uniref:hypothetical protein n=1 Tax=Streptomyces sp. NPDC002669 TaxID=3364658 RepID=UPI00367398AB
MTTPDTSPATPGRTPRPAARSAGTHPLSVAVDPAAARTALVAELEARHGLRPGRPGPVRDALLALPREVLMPQAYVRRSAPGEEPPRWDLLDWSAPQDRPELLGLLHDGGSVLVQHDGEPLVGRAGGTRSGASITSMSTVMGLTTSLLEELELRPGQRALDVGTGAGVTVAVACEICGDRGVVTLDRDRHLTDEPDTDLRRLLESALAAMVHDHGLVPGASPAATVSIVRHRDDHIDTLVPADSPVVALTTSGQVHQVRDDWLARLVADRPERAAYRAALRSGQGFQNPEHRTLLQQLRAHQLLHVNRDVPGGYWVAEAVPEAARHAVVRSWPAADIADKALAHLRPILTAEPAS